MNEAPEWLPQVDSGNPRDFETQSKHQVSEKHCSHWHDWFLFYFTYFNGLCCCWMIDSATHLLFPWTVSSWKQCRCSMAWEVPRRDIQPRLCTETHFTTPTPSLTAHAPTHGLPSASGTFQAPLCFRASRCCCLCLRLPSAGPMAWLPRRRSRIIAFPDLAFPLPSSHSPQSALHLFIALTPCELSTQLAISCSLSASWTEQKAPWCQETV